ncbi:hypothetical protein [Kribbella steppae]|uniref:hypothetical protein n=1 Tax=Kribbella steppae TaxID=2512223 RepID=UPI001042E400|nr:hypothetical protein [Kribbella steppae]
MTRPDAIPASVGSTPLVAASATGCQARRAAGGTPYRDQVFASIDAERYPRLASVADEWVELAGQDTYREGLEALVAGLLPPR